MNSDNALAANSSTKSKPMSLATLSGVKAKKSRISDPWQKVFVSSVCGQVMLVAL
jgi:hypothetical protein